MPHASNDAGCARHSRTFDQLVVIDMYQCTDARINTHLHPHVHTHTQGATMMASDLLPTRLLFDCAVSGPGSLQTLIDCIEVCCTTHQTGLHDHESTHPCTLSATVHTAVEEAILLLVAQTTGSLEHLGRRELRRALTKVCLSVARAYGSGDLNKSGDNLGLTSPLASPGLDKLQGLREQSETNSIFALLEQFTLRVVAP